MFKKITKIIKDASQSIKNVIYADSTDAWQKPHVSPVPGQNENEIPAASVVVLAPGQAKKKVSMDKLRDKIIKDGLAEETSSSESKSIKIFEPDINNPIIPCEEESDEFTEDGVLKTKKSSTYIRTAQDILITPQEMHLGGICYSCHKFTDSRYGHLSTCIICKHNVCSICVKTLDNMSFCPADYKTVIFNLDSWSQERK